MTKTTILIVALVFVVAAAAPAAVGTDRALPTYELPPKSGIPSPATWAIKPQAPMPPAPARRVTGPPPGGQVMRVRVLVVIYTNTAGGTTTPTEITKLKSEIEEARLFYWRNSHAKCHLEISYIQIDEYKEIDEFWALWGGYWMTFWDTDGDGRSVEQDLRNRGVTNNMYSGVANFYAWGENGYAAAIGGGAYGVDVGFLGQTGYCAIPHCWDPDTNDWFFLHEFHHELDSMFHFSGYPSYPHADLPLDLPGDFGGGYDFNAFILRTWPLDGWMGLAAPWGGALATVDNDQDGLPDVGAQFPLTESTFGSSSARADTDYDRLSDLGEAMAGIFRSSNPVDTDTDDDGIMDGSDKYPIYPIAEYTPRGTRTLDGSLEPSWHVMGSSLAMPSGTFNSVVRTNWDPNYLYLAFSINQYATISICLDAANDGWFHGKDNYEIIVNPSVQGLGPVAKAHIWDCSPEAVQQYGGAIWDDDSRYSGRIITESSIRRCSNSNPHGYIVEVAIPRNTTTHLLPGHDERIGLRVVYSDVNSVWSASAQVFECDVFADLVLVDEAGWTRVPAISVAKARADGQVVDLVDKNVSAVFSGAFYVEEQDRSSGIKVVSSAPVAIGDRVRVIGRLGLDSGERVLQNAVVDKLMSF